MMQALVLGLLLFAQDIDPEKKYMAAFLAAQAPAPRPAATGADDELLKQADLAMYKSKEKGGNPRKLPKSLRKRNQHLREF